MTPTPGSPKPLPDDALREALIEKLRMKIEEYDSIVFNPKDAEDILALLTAQSAIAQPVDDGWKMVPVEPTNEMRTAGFQAMTNVNPQIRDIYRAILSASPVVGERHDVVEADAMADRSYITGLQQGYSLGFVGDEAQYQSIMEGRLKQKRDARAAKGH